jgi:anti-sigma B factor antagonist
VVLLQRTRIGGDDVPGTGYETRWVDGVPVVSAPVEIDVTNAGDLREAMQSCLGIGHTTLVIDMSETTFCDSAGVEQLVQASRQAVAAGGEVRLVIGAVSVMRLLAIVGVDRVVPIFTSLDEAVTETFTETSAPSRPA